MKKSKKFWWTIGVVSTLTASTGIGLAVYFVIADEKDSDSINLSSITIIRKGKYLGETIESDFLIPSNIKKIEKDAFKGAIGSIDSFKFDKELTTNGGIVSDSFKGLPLSKGFQTVDWYIYLGLRMGGYQYCAEIIAHDFKIPDDISEIPDRIFNVSSKHSSNTPNSLLPVSIPFSLEGSHIRTIGDYAFAGAVLLGNFIIPNNNPEIKFGKYVFEKATYTSAITNPYTLKILKKYGAHQK